MPKVEITSVADRSEGALTNMHPDINGDLTLLRDDLMEGKGDFSQAILNGQPDGFTLGQPKRAVARNLYGGIEQLTRQNDSPIDIQQTSDVFNRAFVDGEPFPASGDSPLPKPPPPILKKLPATSAGYPASTTSAPYWISFTWGIEGPGGVLHTALAPPTLVPALSQGQSLKVQIPEEAIEGAKFVGLWLTEPGGSTSTTPGTFWLQKTIRFDQFPAHEIELTGPFLYNTQSASSSSDPTDASGPDTTVPPPPMPYSRGINFPGLMRVLQNGAYIVTTFVTKEGETLPSPQFPPPPGWHHPDVETTIEGVQVSGGYAAQYINPMWPQVGQVPHPSVIGWHAYLFLDGQFYRFYDKYTGNGRTKPLPPDWYSIYTQFAQGNEAWAQQNTTTPKAFMFQQGRRPNVEWTYLLYMYPQDPPGSSSAGTPSADEPLPTPVVFGSPRPGPGPYSFRTTEIDEDGKESDPSDIAEIEIGEYDVIRIVFGNRANKIPNATLLERGADGLPLDFTFVQTNGSVSLSAGELIFKTNGAQTGTTPSGITDPIDIDRTKDWSVGALLALENPGLGAFTGSFEAVLRELTSTGTATDTVLKNGAAIGEHAFYQVISAAGGTAPAWRSDTTQAQILYRFSGATKNLTARVSRQILKDYKYKFRRREDPPPGSTEAANPNPSAQTTAVPSGSTALEPSPTPESVPETLTQTPPDRPSASGTTLQTGDLESAMPIGYSQTTSGGATLTRETTPTITPLAGSYSLRSRKASGGSLATSYLSKIYGERTTTLTGAMTNSQTTVPLADLTKWPGSGTVYIDSEKITYTGKSAVNGAGNLTGCTRGSYSSTAAIHSSGAEAALLGRNSIGISAKRQLPTLPGGRVTLGELRRWTDGARFAWVDLDNSNETATLTVTGSPSSSGNITTTLDGAGTTTAVIGVAEQSRLTMTSGVTQPGGTPYTGASVLGLGGVNYNIPVYGGGETARHLLTVTGTAAGTGYFWLYLYDSADIGLALAVYLTSGDSASTIASKIHTAVNNAAAGYAANNQENEWWTSSYTSGATLKLTANSNGLRGLPTRSPGSIMYPNIAAENWVTDTRVGTVSPRLQTEKFQVLGSYIGASTPGFPAFALNLGMPRSQHRSLNFFTPSNGDSAVVVAKKVYDEFQAKYTQYEWNASYTPGSDTVYFIQKNPKKFRSAYATIGSPSSSLPYSITTLYTGGENDTTTDIATRTRSSSFSGWTTGNSGDVVDFFANQAGPQTDITFTGTGGVAGTPSTVVQGVQDTPAQVASKVVTSYSGNTNWTVSASSNVVTFVATSSGGKQDATFSPGTTGTQAIMATPIQGSTDIVANVYDPTTTLIHKRRVQTSVTTSSILNTEISVQGAGKSDAVISVWGSTGTNPLALLGWFEGIDLTDYPAGGVVAGASSESASGLTWDVITDSIEVTDRGKTYYETHDSSGNIVNQVHGHYLPDQEKSQKILLQGYRTAVLPGWQYTFAGKIRYDGVTSGAPFYLTLHTPEGQEYPLRNVASGVSGTGSWQALIDTGISAAGGWQEFTVTFTVPENFYELRMRSKDISSGEFLIQRLVFSPGTTPLRTPYFSTSGTYIATMDISTPAMWKTLSWGRRRTLLKGDPLEAENSTVPIGYTTTVDYRSAPLLAGPYSTWFADPTLVPDDNILQYRLVVASDGISTPSLPSRVPEVDYRILIGQRPLAVFLKDGRRELEGGAVFTKLIRPQQLKDVVVHRLPGERYDRTAVSGRTGRQREFEIQVFTPEAADYITENWHSEIFSFEAFGKWYSIRLSAEPDFQPHIPEREINGQTYGQYIAKMPRAEVVSMGDL